MVLPLAALGILGAVGGSFAMPHIQNYQAKTRGKYNQSVMDGIDMSDPSALSQGLFGGGLLSGSEFMNDARAAFEGDQNRIAAMQRTQATAGAAMARQTQAQQWELQQNQERHQNGIKYLESLGHDLSEFTPDSVVQDLIATQSSLLSQRTIADAVTESPDLLNPTTPEQLLAKQKQDAEIARQAALDRQAAAERTEAERVRLVEAEQAYEAAQQNPAQMLAMAEQALRNFEDADLSGNWSDFLDSTTNAVSANAANKVMDAALAANWRKKRPNEVMDVEGQRSQEKLFPKITEDSIGEENTRAIIRKNLEVFIEDLRTQLATTQSNFEELHQRPAPSLGADPTAGWGPSAGVQ